MRPNQRVTLEVVESDPPLRYNSRIEGVLADHLLIAAPRQRRDAKPMTAGTRLRVTLFHNGGALAFDTTVLGRQLTPLPLLKVERPERIEAMQLRQHFRQPAVLKTLCRATSECGVEIEGLTRNIGGGGVCFRARNVTEASRMLESAGQGEPLWIEIDLPDRLFCALASLVWARCHEDEGFTDLALEFVDLPDTERERLIRYLFALQRDALRKGC